MITMLHSSLVAAGIGLLSGTHTAIWGMYKDAVHEGFAISRFARSIIVGCLCAVVVQWVLVLPVNDSGALVVLFGLAYAAERGIVEVWKTFVRDEDQSKYFIPMQFSIRGRPVRDRRARIAAGATYVAVVASSLVVIARLDTTAGTTLSRVALVGLVPGLIVAIGGCWKDAPMEGFDPLKFMRSPALTVLFALLLSLLTDSYLLVAVATIGFERATAETYKTFFLPGKPRGKFSGKPVTYPEMYRRRRYFVPVYLAIWLMVAVSAVLALHDRVSRGAGAGS